MHWNLRKMTKVNRKDSISLLSHNSVRPQTISSPQKIFLVSDVIIRGNTLFVYNIWLLNPLTILFLPLLHEGSCKNLNFSFSPTFSSTEFSLKMERKEPRNFSSTFNLLRSRLLHLKKYKRRGNPRLSHPSRTLQARKERTKTKLKANSLSHENVLLLLSYLSIKVLINFQ